jgi:hypothetical protein
MRRTTLTFGLVALIACAFARADEPPKDGGASISVTVSDGGDTTIEVRDGDLKVSAGGEQTHVVAGQAVHVKKGQKPKKESLLPAPGELSPGDGDQLHSTEIAFGWAPVKNARQYRVTVIANPKDPTKKVHESTAASGVKSTVKLPAGVWYWRVMGLDAEGLEGKPSAWQKFTIDVTPPKLQPGKPRWK